MNKQFAAIFANKPLQIALIVAALAVGIYWYGKTSAFDKQKLNPALPNNGQGIPAGWSPEPLAGKLYQVMNGVFGFAKDKETQWQIAMSLTNDQLTAVYGAFNRMYCANSNETLTTWIDDESAIYTGSVKGPLLARLRALNLQ